MEPIENPGEEDSTSWQRTLAPRALHRARESLDAAELTREQEEEMRALLADIAEDHDRDLLEADLTEMSES
ncbi:MAG: hypothetical protein ACRDU9_05100 [Acidimicrobiia bacterium]